MKKRKLAIIVDDDAPLLDLLELYLNMFGYEVDKYQSVESCPLFQENIEKCKGCTPCHDVLITDFQMEGINGIDFLQLQQKKGCNIPKIAIMSGSFDSESLARARKLGCKLIHKPFSIDEIKEWLGE